MFHARGGFAILMLASCLGAGSAMAGDVYQCDFPRKRANGDFLAPTVIVEYNNVSGAAIVFDDVIKTHVGTPVDVKVAADNERRLTFTWKVPVKQARSGNAAPMAFRMTIQKGTMRGTLTGQPAGSAGPYAASGRCKVRKP